MTMTDKKLPLASLDQFLARLAERSTVYAPAKDASGDAALAPLRQGDPVPLDYGNFILSPKAFLLPQTQTLLRFRDGKAEEPALPQQVSVLFGVRPCDAAALLALDKVFLDSDPPDPYYAHLRHRTTIIALACTQPAASCFCTSVGGGPGDAAGADVLAAVTDGDLLLTPRTPRGEELLASAGDLLSDATPQDAQAAEELIRAAEGQIAPVRTNESAQRLRDAYDAPVWTVASQKCLGCGACSFLCPTCHCFDITDEVRSGTGRRVRTWDCCAYPLFTLHASGHNPRPTPKERWRQRLMHKFRYAVENYGRFFCVGCGRCIRSCPVSMDLRVVLKEIGA